VTSTPGKVEAYRNMLRMFRKDPRANDFLRFEAERVLRSSIYHMRQVAVIEALLERDAVQPFLVRIPRPRRPAEPRRDAGRAAGSSVRRSGKASSR